MRTSTRRRSIRAARFAVSCAPIAIRRCRLAPERRAMPMQTIEFQYVTGLKRSMFRNARLRGSWNANGRFSNDWTETPMQDAVGEDGCPMFSASVALDLADRSQTFSWGVMVDGPQGSNVWGIATELPDVNSTDCYRQFRLSGADPQIERYFLTYCRRLGANKHFPSGAAAANLRFALWAPNARSVDVVFAKPTHGYVADDGTGIDSAQPSVPPTLHRD